MHGDSLMEREAYGRGREELYSLQWMHSLQFDELKVARRELI